MQKAKIRPVLLVVILIMAATTLVVILRQSAWMRESPLSSLSAHFNTNWAMEPLWDDGKAEVAIYEAERMVYGKIRHFEYTFILVKETFNREFEVKTDDYERNDLFDVMKINKFARIPTHKYPYHYLSSLFIERNNSLPLYKFTNSSQEWCGNTFKHIHNRQDHFNYHYDSYWDNQGRGVTRLPADILFEDQLSYTLRTLKFEKGLEMSFRLAGSEIDNKADDPVIYQARLQVDEANEPIAVAGIEDPGRIWKVRVNLDEDKANTYWFGDEYPNILLRMESWDGRKLSLKALSRDAYWE